MLVNMFKGKLHKVRVTEANLNYVGSITIDEDLMEAAGILPGEKVQSVDINNGSRLETYTICGERGSKTIGINGAAARLVQPGDTVIIISYCWIDDKEALSLVPKVVFCNEKNEIIDKASAEKHGDIK